MLIKSTFSETISGSDALIVCDGQIPDKNILDTILIERKTLIACDGAGHHLIHAQIIPDIIIGDLDSLDISVTDTLEKKPEIIKDVDQETNDLEKALIEVEKRGYERILIGGATGKRIDHTLKNLSVLLKWNQRFDKLLLLDDYGITFITPNKIVADLPQGIVISLMPLNGAVYPINSKGLAWELSDYRLEAGSQDGSSNYSVADRIHIEYTNGALLLFIGYHLPLIQSNHNRG